MPARHHRAMRDRLWQQDPLCYWCRRMTRRVYELQAGRIPDDAATLDHFRSRLDPLRNQIKGEPRHVLACRQCNEERGARDQMRFSTASTNRCSAPPALRSSIESIIQLKHREEQQEYTHLLQQVSELLRDRSAECAA